MDYTETAIATWSNFIQQRFDAFTPSPPGISPDLKVYINGHLTHPSLGHYRNELQEVRRRYPNWRNTILEQFGSEAGQCFVWHSHGPSTFPEDALDLHGVTVLESRDGTILSAHMYFEVRPGGGPQPRRRHLRAV